MSSKNNITGYAAAAFNEAVEKMAMKQIKGMPSLNDFGVSIANTTQLTPLNPSLNVKPQSTSQEIN